MVLVSHRYKFIYVKNVKVAGSSIESLLGRYCVDPNDEYEYTDEMKEKVTEFGILGARWNSSTKWFDHIMLPNILKNLPECVNYKRICAVRNPFDYYVSRYYWGLRKNPKLTFESAIKNPIRPHYIDPCLIQGIPSCDYYIKFENLEEDLMNVCHELGIPCDISILPKHKAGVRPPNTDYRTFYTDELKQIVSERHKMEIEKFGYTF